MLLFQRRSRRKRPKYLSVLACLLFVCLGLALPPILAHGEKGERWVNLYDIAPTFDGSPFDWKAISDAYINQILATANSNGCITPQCMPQRFAGNTGPQRMGPSEGTAGLDYMIEGDLIKVGDEYRIDLFMVDNDREVVARNHSGLFTKKEDAVWAARSAALWLGGSDKSSKPLADVILDWEKKQRERYSQTCAIGATLTWDLPENEKNNLEMKPGEKKKLPIKLIDCDGYKLAGRKLTIETAQGKVEPAEVTTDSEGKATVTYTAPDQPCDATIRAGWNNYRYGSMLLTRQPAVDWLHIKVKSVSYTGTITLQRTGKGKGLIGYAEQEIIKINRLSPFSSDQTAWIADSTQFTVSGNITDTISDQSGHIQSTVSSNGWKDPIPGPPGLDLFFITFDTNEHKFRMVIPNFSYNCTDTFGDTTTWNIIFAGYPIVCDLPVDTSHLTGSTTVNPDQLGVKLVLSWDLTQK